MKRKIKSIWIFFILILLISFSLALAREKKVLIYSTKIYWNYPYQEFLDFYKKELEITFRKENYKIEWRTISKKEALEFLKRGIYDCICELEITGIKNQVSLDWKIYKIGKKRPVYFYITGDAENIIDLVSNTLKYFKTILEEKVLVEKIKVKGNIRISKELIFSEIKTKPNEILDFDKLNEDLRSIYKLGYFENVEILLEQGERGVIVIFQVKERPSVKEVVFEGNKKIKSDDLAKIVNIKKDTIVTSETLDKALENIKNYYEQLGYHGTKVKILTKKISPTEIKLIFHIKEGKKKYIKKIEFIGNKAFSDKKLKKYLSVSEKTFFSPVKKIVNYLRTIVHPEPLAEPGVYNWVLLERDLGRIETFYKNKGYIDAKVGEPIVEEEEGEVIIKIPIHEGSQYRVGKIKIIQDMFPEKEIYKKLRLKPGKVFSLLKLKQDESYILHMFANRGYAYAKVDLDIKKDPQRKLIDITYKVNKGPLVYINRIEIQGNVKTRDKVIRRELLLAEKWPYSAERFEKSEERLRRLGFFEDVKIEKEKGAKENELNLKIKVKEMLTGTFGIGGGYSTVDKFILMVNVTERNFLGKGQRVSLMARIGTKRSRYSINFYDPYFMDTRYSLGTSLYNYMIEYEDFTKDSKGFSIQTGYDFTINLSGYIGYRYDDTDLEDLREEVSKIILESKDIHITSAVRAGLTYDSRNRYFLPTKGWYHNVEIEYAGGILGGDSNYVKAVLNHQIYFSLFHTTFHFNLGYGYITEGSGKRVPVFERFFLGGINSVRGYEYGDISPTDPKTGEKIGGTRMFYLQTENIFPILKNINLNGVIFFDMGLVWDKKTGFYVSDIRKSVGVGLRWLSPLGPLRIEWGYNIDKKPGEDNSNFNFQIGGSF